MSASHVRGHEEQTDQTKDEGNQHSFGLRPSGSAGGASIRNDWTIAPQGVFCQRPDIYRKKLPTIPDHFSVKIETVDEVLNDPESFSDHLK